MELESVLRILIKSHLVFDNELKYSNDLLDDIYDRIHDKIRVDLYMDMDKLTEAIKESIIEYKFKNLISK